MLTLIDAHVHVHFPGDVASLLDAALGNFTVHADRLRARDWNGVLLLSEMNGAAWFESVLAAGGSTAGRWAIHAHLSDPLALWASVGGRRLLVVAGRQIVTAERIEVLTLMTRARLRDGDSLEETLRLAHEARALVVLPWAAGKWIGERGERVSSAVAGGSPRTFCGDNGGRPVFWPRPTLFALESARGKPLLSGSDPLPLAGDERRVGSFGVVLDAPLDDASPALRLRDALQLARAADVRAFGRLQRPSTFLRNQFGLRLARGRVKAPAAPQSSGGRETPDIETSSAGYASRFTGTAGRYLLGVQSATVHRVLADLPPGRALDVGGGHGQLVQVLRTLGWQVVVQGTDALCRTHLRELHGHRDVEFLEGDLFALPAADRSFDLVIAVRLVSHVDDWPRLLGEMSRVARRSVVIDYPGTGGLNALTPLLFGLKKRLEGNTRRYTSFSRAALEAEFARHGFRRAREVRQFLLPMVVHRVGRAMWPLRLAERLARVTGLTALLGSPAILRVDRR